MWQLRTSRWSSLNISAFCIYANEERVACNRSPKKKKKKTKKMEEEKKKKHIHFSHSFSYLEAKLLVKWFRRDPSSSRRRRNEMKWNAEKLSWNPVETGLMGPSVESTDERPSTTQSLRKILNRWWLIRWVSSPSWLMRGDGRWWRPKRLLRLLRLLCL